MLLSPAAIDVLEMEYFDHNNKLAAFMLIEMYGREYLEELQERWSEWPNYVHRKRLNAQEAHQKYQPIP